MNTLNKIFIAVFLLTTFKAHSAETLVNLNVHQGSITSFIVKTQNATKNTVYYRAIGDLEGKHIIVKAKRKNQKYVAFFKSNGPLIALPEPHVFFNQLESSYEEMNQAAS